MPPDQPSHALPAVTASELALQHKGVGAALERRVRDLQEGTADTPDFPRGAPSEQPGPVSESQEAPLAEGMTLADLRRALTPTDEGLEDQAPVRLKQVTTSPRGRGSGASLAAAALRRTP